MPVGKAYFGFTDEELAEIDRYVRNNTGQPFRPGPRGRPRGRARPGPRGRLRRAAALDAAQVGRRDALPADRAAALGQAARRGRHVGDAGEADPGMKRGVIKFAQSRAAVGVIAAASDAQPVGGN